MATRPGDFDITTPTGASSPRAGDDELRKIKTYTQNAYFDLTRESGVGVSHTDLYGVVITADDGFSGTLLDSDAVLTKNISDGAITHVKVATSAIDVDNLIVDTVSPGVNEVLGYDTANGRFEWVTNAGADSVADVYINTSVPEIEGNSINSDAFSVTIPGNTGRYRLEVVDTGTDVTVTAPDGVTNNEVADNLLSPTTYPASDITGQVAIANGGTGASSASGARTNLGLGTAATLNTQTTITNSDTAIPTSGAVVDYVNTGGGDTLNTGGGGNWNASGNGTTYSGTIASIPNGSKFFGSRSTTGTGGFSWFRGTTVIISGGNGVWVNDTGSTQNVRYGASGGSSDGDSSSGSYTWMRFD